MGRERKNPLAALATATQVPEGTQTYLHQNIARAKTRSPKSNPGRVETGDTTKVVHGTREVAALPSRINDFPYDSHGERNLGGLVVLGPRLAADGDDVLI